MVGKAIRAGLIFPFNAREDGSCEKFEDGQCSIYDDRPEVCRVDKMYDRYFKNVYTIEEYLKETKMACESMRKELKHEA
jgi:Fe-S-cluster containining protein